MKLKSNDFLPCMCGCVNNVFHPRSRLGQEVIRGIRDIINNTDNLRIVPEDVEREVRPSLPFLSMDVTLIFKQKREKTPEVLYGDSDA
jgi:hypothetical protein